MEEWSPLVSIGRRREDITSIHPCIVLLWDVVHNPRPTNHILPVTLTRLGQHNRKLISLNGQYMPGIDW